MIIKSKKDENKIIEVSLEEWNKMKKLQLHRYWRIVSSRDIEPAGEAARPADVVNFMNVIVSCAGVGQPLKIYINGVDDTQRADTLTSYLRVCNSEVRIGNSDTGQGGNFAGIIDEFCFWRRGLTATEIVQLSSGNANSFYPFI